MAKLTLQLQSAQPASELGSQSHDGGRPKRWETDDDMIADMPDTKKKSLLRNQKDVQDQGGLMYPNDYIDKMFVSKANWLGLISRGKGESE